MDSSTVLGGQRCLRRFAIAALLVAAALELGARAVFALRGASLDLVRACYWNPRRAANLYEPHPYLPYVLRANLDLPGVRTNSLGRRGREPRDDAFRILCLGASATFGPTGEEGAWPSLLERETRRRYPGRRFDVQNGGVPGYTSADNLIDFALRGVNFAPQVVVVQSGANDVLLSPSPAFRSDHSHARRSLAWEPNLLDYAPQVFEESAFFLLVRQVLHGRWRTALAGPVTATAVPFPTDGVYRGLPTFRRNLRSLIALARFAGASVVFVTHPFLPAEPGWDRAMEDTAQAVREVTAEEGAALADAQGEIRDPALFKPEDPVHLSPEGDLRVADLVLRAIETTGRLGP